MVHYQPMANTNHTNHIDTTVQAENTAAAGKATRALLLAVRHFIASYAHDSYSAEYAKADASLQRAWRNAEKAAERAGHKEAVEALGELVGNARQARADARATHLHQAVAQARAAVFDLAAERRRRA